MNFSTLDAEPRFNDAMFFEVLKRPTQRIGKCPFATGRIRPTKLLDGLDAGWYQTGLRFDVGVKPRGQAIRELSASIKVKPDVRVCE